MRRNCWLGYCEMQGRLKRRWMADQQRGAPNWLGFSDQGASKTMLFGTAISPYGRSGSRA